MKNTIKRTGFLLIVGALLLAPTMSCRKKKDTIAKITVRNSNNELVAGAAVHMYPEASDPQNGGSPNSLLWDYHSTTDASGVATFDFNEIYQLGQAGVVVSNIDVSKDGASGTGIIKVDQETTSEETVFI